MACSVPYIRSAYAGHKELIDKLETINRDIFEKVAKSGLFRKYGQDSRYEKNTWLFAKKGTKQFQKQREFIKSINSEYNVPTGLSLIHAKLTKYGNNERVNVTVHPIAEQVWFTTDAAKKIQIDKEELGIDEQGESNLDLLANEQVSPDIKPGVDELFEQNPELTKIGTPEQYSQYLNTIFPDSKVKEIVYHGSHLKFDTPFDLSKRRTSLTESLPNGIYFSSERSVANTYSSKGGAIYPALINLSSPRIIESNKDNPSITAALKKEAGVYGIQGIKNSEIGKALKNLKEEIKKNSDGVILQGIKDSAISSPFKPLYNSFDIPYQDNENTYVVFDPSQIHVLSSKQDIEGFKRFIGEGQNVLLAKSQRGTTDPLLQEKYFPDGNTTTSTAILEKISNSGHALAPLAKTLLKYDVDPSEVELVDYDAISVGGKFLAAAVYHHNSGKIQIAKNARFKEVGSEPTLIHEILHSLSYSQIHSGSQAAKDFKKLFDFVKENEDAFTDKYPLTDEDEFLTGIFTNPKFISELKGLPAIDGVKYKNLWEQILDWFKTLFNMSSDEGGLFEQAMAVSTHLINTNAEELNAFREFRSIPDEVFLANERAGSQISEAEENQSNKSQGSTQSLSPLEVSNRFTEISKDIEKKPVKQKNKETGEEETIDRYFYKGKQILFRVSDKVKNVYKNLFDNTKELTKDDYQQALDEAHREKGVAGHGDLEHLSTLMINPDTHQIVTEEQFLDNLEKDDKYTPQIKNETIYQKLAMNLWARMSSFPSGTIFHSEMSIINDSRKDDIGGTVDLLAISPDKNTGVKVSILDWKFIRLNTNYYTEVPWFKIKAWNTQMKIYKKIIEEKYGIKPNQFAQTRMVPIVSQYENMYNTKTKEWVNTLTGIEIGDSNPQNIADDKDYLIPVGLETESTGDPNLDNLIQKLNAMYENISNRAVPEEGRQEKALRLNSLMKAIRYLQVKNNIAPLLVQANAINSEMQKLMEEYEGKFKGKGPNELPDGVISYYISRMIDVQNELEVIESLNSFLKNIHDNLLSKADKSDEQIQKDRNLVDAVNAAVLSAGTNKEELNSTILQFTNDFVGKKFGNYDILNPERIVTFLQKNFKSASNMPIQTVQVLQRLAAQVKDSADLELTKRISDLTGIKEEYDKMAASTGLNKRNYFNIIKQRDKKGKYTNELVYQYSQEFYDTLKKKAKSSDTKWIKENIDFEAYQKYQQEQLVKKLAKIDQSPSYGMIQNKEGKWVPEDNSAREGARNKLKKQFNFADKFAPVWKDYKALRKFPLEKWESEDYISLKKNEAAFKFYNYILDLNKYLVDIGYIEGYNARKFLPYVRSSFVENLALGNKPRITAKIMESIAVDEATVGYGKIDPLTGELVNKIPAYYTSKLPLEDTSNDLFKNLLVLAHTANRYKYLNDIEGMVKGLSFVERNKGVLKTNRYGNVLFGEDGVTPEVDKTNTINYNIYEDNMRSLIYGQKYTGENSVDAIVTRMSKLGKKVNEKLGRDVFPEEPSSVSMIRSIEGLNSFFYLLHLNPLNVLSPLSNYFGGNIQTAINAGELFSTKDFGSSMLRLLPGWFDIQKGLKSSEKLIKMLDYFMPYTEGVVHDRAAKLSLTKFNETNVNNAFFYTMRSSDRKVQAATLLALLSNTVVVNGRMFNVNDYVKGKKEYRDRYKNGNVKEMERKAKQEISELKEKYSVEKLAKINGKGEFEIPGITHNSSDVHEIRRLTEKISSEALGNMSEADTRGMNRSIATKSMMMFKNWIPKLVETRFGNLNEVGGDSYEWGRVRTWFKFAGTNWLAAAKSLVGHSLVNQNDIEGMRKLYQKEADLFRKKNGKDWKMTEDQFFDMVRQNIHNDMKDFLTLTAMMSLFLLAKGLKGAEPDDDDPRVKASFNFMVRVMDKLSDEVSYYYSPKGATQLLSGGLFPSAGVLVNGVRTFTHFSKEMFGLVLKNDELVEDNQSLKYLMRSLPFTKQMTDMLPLFAPEAAKDLGIRMQSSNDFH